MPVIKKRVDRPVGVTTGWFTEKQKMDAFILYLSLGNLAQVAEQLGINYKTLCKWKYSPWWKDKLNELEQGSKVKLGSKVAVILDKASDSIIDRLDNGNLFYDYKTKTISRKPLTIREVAEVMKVGIQAQELNDKARQALEDRDNKDARAAELTARLEKIANFLSKTTKAPEIIDITPIEVSNAV